MEELRECPFWHDEEKCQNCEYNSVKQNEPTPSENEISSSD